MIETSETIGAIGEALRLFQKETHGVVRDSVNPFHKSRYASLEAVIETARPALQSAGLAFLQAPGAIVGGSIEISTLLIHPKSGEWIRSTMAMPLAKPDPQGVGSATTYGCRYALMASLGLPPLDDDAEATRQPDSQKRAPEPPSEPQGALNNPTFAADDEYLERCLRYIDKQTSTAKLYEWWEREVSARARLPAKMQHEIRQAYQERGRKLAASSTIKGPEAA